MTYNTEYEKTDDLLFKQLSKQSREIVKLMSKKVTAQELIDQA